MNLPDWKKQAAQVVDDAEIEKAFLDQAYSAIANKARPIMQAPYRLGFEIVFKNDNATRMCGVFAFRIGRDLYYAPVFFLNGEIKGTDLLYRHKTKTFVPLTEEWVRYLLESNNSDAGSGVERRFTTQIPQHFNINKLRSSSIGTQGKSASTDEAPDFKNAWADIEKLASAGKSPGPILRDFILEDGGFSALALIEGAMTRDFKFANALHTLVPEDHYAPADLLSTVKAASEKPAPVLVLHRGDFEPGSVKCASEDYFKKGYWLEDMRKSADLATVFDDVDAEGEFRSPDTAGVYDMIMKGGEQRDILVARADGPSTLALFVMIDPATGEYLMTSRPGMGRIIKGGADMPNFADKLKSTMETGKAYCVYNTPSQTLSSPIYIKSKKKVDGVTHYTTYSPWSSTPREMRANPDYTKVKLGDGIIGADAKFVEVDAKWVDNRNDSGGHPELADATFTPGTQEDVTAFLIGGGMKFASIHRIGDEFTLRTGEKAVTAPMSKVAMLCHVAKNLRIQADVAEGLIEKAATLGRTRFIMELPANAKAASAVMLQAEPQFDPMLDPQFNALVDPERRYTVDTDFSPEPTPRQRIGDAWDPANMQGALETATPQQLAEISQQGAPHIFEHGVVGELVKTYDAAAMIQKYIPKMEEALDCLGRILFLLYWKPDDLKKTYGADDLTNKENEILSSFKAFGDLLLDLIKQTKPDRSGTASMGS